MEVCDELSDWDAKRADETQFREQHVRNLHIITNIFITCCRNNIRSISEVENWFENKYLCFFSFLKP